MLRYFFKLINFFYNLFFFSKVPDQHTAEINVAIEGLIGSGKSSLIKYLNEMGFCTEEQNFYEIQSNLDLFYEKERTSESIYNLQKNIHCIYKNIWDKKYKNPIKIRFLEGIISNHNVFTMLSRKKGELNNEHFLKLEEKCSLVNSKIIPDIICYLDSSPEICKERILNDTKRNIEKKFVDLNYLKELQDEYFNFFRKLKSPLFTENSKSKIIVIKNDTITIKETCEILLDNFKINK